MAKTPRDWTKTGTIAAMARWLREESGALAVIVMREGDGALDVHAEIAPKDVEGMMCVYLAPLIEDLARARAEKRSARVKWENLEG